MVISPSTVLATKTKKIFISDDLQTNKYLDYEYIHFSLLVGK